MVFIFFPYYYIQKTTFQKFVGVFVVIVVVFCQGARNQTQGLEHVIESCTTELHPHLKLFFKNLKM